MADIQNGDVPKNWIYELDLFSKLSRKQAWNLIWEKVDAMLPQMEPGISEHDILNEIRAYRKQKKLLSR